MGFMNAVKGVGAAVLDRVTNNTAARRKKAMAQLREIALREANGKTDTSDVGRLEKLLEAGDVTLADYNHALTMVQKHAEISARALDMAGLVKAKVAAAKALNATRETVEAGRKALAAKLESAERALWDAEQAENNAELAHLERGEMEHANGDLFGVDEPDLLRCCVKWRGDYREGPTEDAPVAYVDEATYRRCDEMRSALWAECEAWHWSKYNSEMDAYTAWLNTREKNCEGRPIIPAIGAMKCPANEPIRTWGEVLRWLDNGKK